MQPSPHHAKTPFCHTNHPRATHGLFTFTGDCCTTRSTALFIYLLAFFHWSSNKTYRISKRNASKKKHLSLFFCLFACFLQVCLQTWNVLLKGYHHVLFPFHQCLTAVVNLRSVQLIKSTPSIQAAENCSPALSRNITIMLFQNCQ